MKAAVMCSSCTLRPPSVFPIFVPGRLQVDLEMITFALQIILTMRRYLLVLVIPALFICRSTSANTLQSVAGMPSGTVSLDSVTVTTSELADRLIEVAMKYRGVPYRLGGKGPNMFDCSGFTRYVYRIFGYDISSTAAAQSKDGREVKGCYSDLQKGDLIIFGSRRNVKKIGHVGIYIGPDKTGDGFTFIHAAVHGGVQVSNISEKYYSSRFLGVRRILPDFYATGNDSSVLRAYDGTTYTALRDTLELGQNDSRIILFADGTWAYVNPDGMVANPEGTDKIVLSPDGRWTPVQVNMHIIPSVSATPEPSPARVAPSGGESQTGTETAEYYTIKSGDTLSAIAVKCHTSVSSLCRLNGITTKTVLRIGRKLRVK